MAGSQVLSSLRLHASEGVVETPIEGLRLFRISAPVERVPGVYPTGICAIAQGARPTLERALGSRTSTRRRRRRTQTSTCCSGGSRTTLRARARWAEPRTRLSSRGSPGARNVGFGERRPTQACETHPSDPERCCAEPPANLCLSGIRDQAQRQEYIRVYAARHRLLGSEYVTLWVPGIGNAAAFPHVAWARSSASRWARIRAVDMPAKEHHRWLAPYPVFENAPARWR